MVFKQKTNTGSCQAPRFEGSRSDPKTRATLQAPQCTRVGQSTLLANASAHDAQNAPGAVRTSNRGFPSSAVSSRPATGFQESSPSTLPPFAAFPSHASARILHNVVVGPCAPDDVPQISALPTFLEESRHEFVVSHRCAEDSDTKWITSDPRFAYRDSPSSKDCRTSSRTFCMPQLNSNGMKLFPVLMLFSCVPHPSSSAQTYEFALELHEEPGTSTNFANNMDAKNTLSQTPTLSMDRTVKLGLFGSFRVSTHFDHTFFPGAIRAFDLTTFILTSNSSNSCTLTFLFCIFLSRAFHPFFRRR